MSKIQRVVYGVVIVFILSNLMYCSGTNALMKALQNRDTEQARELIKAGAEINVQNNAGISPLIYAVAIDDAGLVELLLDKGADPTVKTNGGISPLDKAAYQNNTKIIRLLMTHGAELNGFTTLEGACIKGSNDALRLLIKEYGAEVNMQDKNGSTPLHFAAYNGKTETCKLLVQEGVDPLIPNNSGILPIHYAVKQDNYSVVEYLLSFPSSIGVKSMINAKDGTGFTPLSYAVSQENYTLVQLLVGNGADVNILNDKSQGPLHGAVMLQNQQITEYLLQLGADPNLGEKNATPLFTATKNKNVSFVKLLLEYEANPDLGGTLESTDSDQKVVFPPLYVAAQIGLYSIAETLLENGANPDIAVGDNTIREYVEKKGTNSMKSLFESY